MNNSNRKLTVIVAFVVLLNGNRHSLCAAVSGSEESLISAAPAGGHCATSEADSCADDELGFDAIRSLHRLIDDDQNGNLDREESVEFLREELKSSSRNVDGFHGSDDHISVEDLWKLWTLSNVYNWTVEDTVGWLHQHVELPQYAEQMRLNGINGRSMPLIAVGGSFVQHKLGVKNLVHRQRLVLKALDAVLFGPPRSHGLFKDVVLFVVVVVCIFGGWLAYRQHNTAQTQIRQLLRHMDKLSEADSSLQKVQSQLQKAEAEQQSVLLEKQSLEEKMQSEIVKAKEEAERLKSVREATPEELQRLHLAERELVQVRNALRQAEMQRKDPSLVTSQLQPWLQITYERESRHYETKRAAAEMELLTARDMCDRINRKRTAFLGAFRVAHTTSMDETDQQIISARESLEELKRSLQERSVRWHAVERLLGLPVLSNPGLKVLDAMVQNKYNNVSGIIGSDEWSVDHNDVPSNQSSFSLMSQSYREPSPSVRSSARPSAMHSLLKEKEIESWEMQDSSNSTLSSLSSSNSIPSTSIVEMRRRRLQNQESVVGDIHEVNRPKSLKTSCSDSVLNRHEIAEVNSSAVSTPAMPPEDDSSPESTDGSTVSERDGKSSAGKKTKKRLFHKIFKKGHVQ